MCLHHLQVSKYTINFFEHPGLSGWLLCPMRKYFTSSFPMRNSLVPLSARVRGWSNGSNLVASTCRSCSSAKVRIHVSCKFSESKHLKGQLGYPSEMKNQPFQSIGIPRQKRKINTSSHLEPPVSNENSTLPVIWNPKCILARRSSLGSRPVWGHRT